MGPTGDGSHMPQMTDRTVRNRGHVLNASVGLWLRVGKSPQLEFPLGPPPYVRLRLELARYNRGFVQPDALKVKFKVLKAMPRSRQWLAQVGWESEESSISVTDAFNNAHRSRRYASRNRRKSTCSSSSGFSRTPLLRSHLREKEEPR